MKLFRVRMYGEWDFILAENGEAAKSLELEFLGDPHGELDDYKCMKIVEYPLDKPMMLPEHWQTDAREITE